MKTVRLKTRGEDVGENRKNIWKKLILFVLSEGVKQWVFLLSKRSLLSSLASVFTKWYRIYCWINHTGLLTSLQQSIEQGGIGEEEEVAKGLRGERWGKTCLPWQHQGTAIHFHQSSYLGRQGGHIIYLFFSSSFLFSLCSLSSSLLFLLLLAGKWVGVQKGWKKGVQRLCGQKEKKKFYIKNIIKIRKWWMLNGQYKLEWITWKKKMLRWFVATLEVMAITIFCPGPSLWPWWLFL